MDSRETAGKMLIRRLIRQEERRLALQNISDVDYGNLLRFDKQYLSDRSACIDETLRLGGILRLTNVPSCAEHVQDISRQFFILPKSVKFRYMMAGRTYNNGWSCASFLSGQFDESSTYPDIFEVFRFGPEPFFDDVSMARYYPENRWPSEVPELQRTLTRYSQQMQSIGSLVLRMLAHVLAIEESFFIDRTRQAMWSQGINYYPNLRGVELGRTSQFRLPSHTDFGTVSLIERESDAIPLQVNSGGVWADVRHYDRTIIVLLGDILERWTGGRWRATQHRVSSSLDGNANEDLISSIFFLVADPTAVVSPLPEPFGGGENFEPITAGEYFLQRMVAIQGPDQSP